MKRKVPKSLTTAGEDASFLIAMSAQFWLTHQGKRRTSQAVELLLYSHLVFRGRELVQVVAAPRSCERSNGVRLASEGHSLHSDLDAQTEATRDRRYPQSIVAITPPNSARANDMASIGGRSARTLDRPGGISEVEGVRRFRKLAWNSNRRLRSPSSGHEVVEAHGHQDLLDRPPHDAPLVAPAADAGVHQDLALLYLELDS
jgi:hypothetical protein